MFQECIKAIEESRVYEVAVSTPLERATGLSLRLNNHVFLKREDLQPIFSFKIRGAYNKIIQISEAQKKLGIIAASAGNHAQGVAMSAQKLGILASIVMPVTTPKIKVEAVKNMGAEIISQGDTYDQAFAHAIELSKKSGMIFIPPYDDPDIIAGQGTIGKEITAQFADKLDAIFIPVGGGGLIAGVSAWIKHIWPETLVIGVEPADAPTLHTALQNNKPTTLENVGLFVDGVAVQKIGEETFKIAKHTVDATVLVSTDEICAAIKDNFDDTRTLLEPAGALAIAGLKKYVKEGGVQGQNLAAINSGANINFDRLKHIVERYEIGEGNESLLGVTIPERPGSFLEFCRTIGKRTITEFNYRYSDQVRARVFVGLQFSAGEKVTIIKSLRGKGYEVFDLSDDEMAKLHLRHMIGGHIRNTAKSEHLCRFQFPERPGALLEFLEHIGDFGWNISLFHYRNHGSAYGRVLAGIQIPDNELEQFKLLMHDTEYNYRDESENPSYELFLG